MSEKIRKAAILITTLDERSAKALLDNLPTVEAARVRRAARRLEDVSPREREAIVDEFLGRRTVVPPSDAAGVELDDSLLQRLNSPIEVEPEEVEKAAPQPFRSLHRASAESLARHLQHENPQVIAVVVSHLKPEQAADLIARFDDRTQAEVLRRVADLDLAPREVLDDLESELEVLIADDIQTTRNREAGLLAVTAILDAAGSDRGRLATNLARYDRALADKMDAEQDELPHEDPELGPGTEEPELGPATPAPQPAAAATVGIEHLVQRRPERAAATEADPEPAREPAAEPQLTFDEIQHLDSASLAQVFAETDPKIALLALTGASPEFVGRLLAEMPAVEAHKLRQRMEQIGPLRLDDIARAQQQLADTAADLINGGKINPAQRFAVAA